ncbi:hypothetical protein [Streptomyces aureus]|uniref:hypothetical protein n=1 Tax=Streptomyces aureus TaxID=193461 RepID=UPI00362BC4A4
MARLRAAPAARGGAAEPRARSPHPASPPLPARGPLRGEDSRLVRPYLLAHEQREQAKRQRGRRRTLWLAVHGVDIGPRRIPGVEVVA